MTSVSCGIRSRTQTTVGSISTITTIAVITPISSDVTSADRMAGSGQLSVVPKP